jgi:hypothetical protein
LSSLYSTVFAKNLQLKQMEMERLRADQANRQMQQEKTQQVIFQQQDRAEKAKDAEFNRHLKVAEMQGKYMGMLGKQAPQFENPAYQEMAEASWMGGAAETEKQFRDIDKAYGVQEAKDREAWNRNALNEAGRQGYRNAQIDFRYNKEGADQDEFKQTFDQRGQHYSDLNAQAWARINKMGGTPGALSPAEGREQRRYSYTHGKDMRLFAKLKADARHVSGLLKAVDQDEAIAGTGPVVGYIPSYFIGAEGMQNRSVITRFLNAIIHDQSGAAVTAGELARNLQGTLLNPKAKPADIRLGINALLAALDADMRAAEASIPPEALDEYQARPGSVSADTYLEDAPVADSEEDW